MNEIQNMTSNTFFAGWDVFAGWVFTPTGALLTLLLLAVTGTATYTTFRLGAAPRWLTILAKTIAVMWIIWILGGVLGRMGAPVRQVLTTVFSWIPALLEACIGLFTKLINTAG